MLSARVTLGARPVAARAAAPRPAARAAVVVARARGAAWSPGDTAPEHLDGRRVGVVGVQDRPGRPLGRRLAAVASPPSRTRRPPLAPRARGSSPGDASRGPRARAPARISAFSLCRPRRLDTAASPRGMASRFLLRRQRRPPWPRCGCVGRARSSRKRRGRRSCRRPSRPRQPVLRPTLSHLPRPAACRATSVSTRCTWARTRRRRDRRRPGDADAPAPIR